MSAFSVEFKNWESQEAFNTAKHMKLARVMRDFDDRAEWICDLNKCITDLIREPRVFGQMKAFEADALITDAVYAAYGRSNANEYAIGFLMQQLYWSQISSK